MKLKTLILLAVILLLGLAACQTMNQNLSPQARYYSALKLFNDNLAEYKAVYETQPPWVQTDWRAKINPVIRAASNALDAWRLAMGTATADEKEALWLKQKDLLLQLLIQQGVLKVKGGA